MKQSGRYADGGQMPRSGYSSLKRGYNARLTRGVRAAIYLRVSTSDGSDALSGHSRFTLIKRPPPLVGHDGSFGPTDMSYLRAIDLSNLMANR